MTGDDKIQRANLDGSQREDLITTGLNFAYWVVLDVAAGKMYWTDGAGRMIRRANLDGSNIEDLVSTMLQGPSSLQGIALDLSAGVMYWTQAPDPQIQRACLYGSGVETVASGLSLAIGIAAGPDKPLVHGIPALGPTGTVLLCAALFATAAIFGRSRLLRLT